MAFLEHLCLIIPSFLRERVPVHLKREALNLIGLIYNLKTYKGDYVHDRLSDGLMNLQR